MCHYWGSRVDDMEHTLFIRDRWGAARGPVYRAMCCELTPDTMVPLMLRSEKSWKHIESFITQVKPEPAAHEVQS